MPTSEAILAAHLAAVASELNAESGDDGYYRGTSGTAPFLFKLISAEPLVYMFKFRVTEPHDLPSEWPDSLPEEYADAEVGCEIEGDYIFLWVRNASVLEAKEVAALVSKCLADYAQYFPERENYCFLCKEYGPATLVQSSAAVATVCQECLDQKSREKEAEYQRINASNSALYLFLPLALVVSSLGWAGFWWFYDWIFGLLANEYILLPTMLLVVLVFAVGFGLGWPVGKLLHRSGVVKHVSSLGLSIGAALLTVVGGELFTAVCIVLLATRTLDVSLIQKITLSVAFGGSLIYSIIKLIFVCALSFGIYQVAKPKAARLIL